MKNCVVKMVVKSRGRTNPEEPHSEQADELLSTQTINASRTTEEKESLGVQLKSLLGSFEKMIKEVGKSGKIHQIQPRDRKVIWDLPIVREGERMKKQQLEQWITGLCNEVFSAAFNYFETGRMNYDQAKIYCSENMISNIMRLSEAYQLTADEMKMIDQHIQEGVSSYLLSKYPMNEAMVVNKALEAQVKETDNIEALQNDIFFYQDNSFGFEYRQSGIYNDLIMRLINHLMARIDEKESNNKKTFYEQFYETMQTTFEKIESRQEMEGKSDSKDQLAKRTDAQKYRARVKAYTSWAIGRKISQNVDRYTETEIESMHMTIKSPAILRILTKWCEELWNKFEKKNYFLDRTENVKCQKGRNVNTYFAWMKEIINKMVEDEKGEIQRFLEQVFANNYDQQAIHCFRSLKANSFNHVEKFEKAAGIFTINIVNNLHSYIILYLNRIIHGLLKVSKRVYDKELIGKARWSSPPNLISFKIGDLMRCKIGSQEKEILWLFRKISEYSERKPEFLKIIRIKNRLKEGTNDILMNVRFKNEFICEVQLAVNSDHSNFIKCSNKYNHFIYEVKRSIFGPISELCSIWRSLDGRCKVYEKMAGSKKNNAKTEDIILRGASNQQSAGHRHEMQRYFQPFVCSTCHETYSHCNYIWPHRRCETCTTFAQCCKCQIAAENENDLKEKLLKTTQLKELATRSRREDQIPKYGLCILIESKHIYVQKFIKLNVKSKLGLYCRRGKNQISLITDLTSKKEIDAFKDKYIIFKLPNDPKVKNKINISEQQAKNEFVLPKLVKSNYKKEKQYISLIGENIDDVSLAKILEGSQNNRSKIRSMELPDNCITTIDFICKDFPNLSKLVLSRNKITDIEGIGNLICLTQLNIRDNQITILPPNLFKKLPKLQSLNLRNNKFNSIPDDIQLLTDLTKLELNQLSLKQLPKTLGKMKKLEYIDLDKNQLGEVPEQLRPLINLYHLGLSRNGIKEVPEWIGQLKALKELELNKNKLSNLPVTIADLPVLSDLQLNENCFQKLNFKCPDSLNTILLNESKIQQIGDVFFANCKNLVKIQLNGNKITNLPRNLGINCSKVKSLSLNNNNISDIPSLFGIFLPTLELIELNNNKFKEFPRALINCYQLVEFHLANNPEFDDIIPVSFLDNNYKIEGFDFSGTKLSRIPRELNLAGTLKRLNFTGTTITCENLQVLQGLQFLEEILMASMNLTSLPKSLKSQHSLHILNVSNNKLIQIDDDFFTKLTHLRTVNFAKNQLKTVPSSFQACKRIRGINFSSNQLTELPSAIFQFTKIEKIIFGSNQIKVLDSKQKYLPPSVTLFDLSDNQISEISDSFFERAEGLQELNLSKNQLKAPPKFIRDCEHLNKTDFNDNPMQLKAEDAIRQTLMAFVKNQQEDLEDDVIFNKESLMNTFMR